MKTRAQTLRINSSPVERRMRRLLFSLRTGGYHFRKQSPIGPFVVDFACHHAKLVIEVDGDTHGSAAAQRIDARRDAFHAREGYPVPRFSNADVLKNAEGVFAVVANALEDRPRNLRSGRPLPIPPHKGEGAPPVALTENMPHTKIGTSPLVGEGGRGDSDA